MGSNGGGGSRAGRLAGGGTTPDVAGRRAVEGLFAGMPDNFALDNIRTVPSGVPSGAVLLVDFSLRRTSALPSGPNALTMREVLNGRAPNELFVRRVQKIGRVGDRTAYTAQMGYAMPGP